jgi:hypothetical protein
VEAQQEKLGIKMFFRQGEVATLLKSCTAGLAQAVGVFMVNFVSVSAFELSKQTYGRLIMLMWSRISTQ